MKNQRVLVYWRWLLSAVTCALDYAGAVLNFMCVALPVAAGKPYPAFIQTVHSFGGIW